MLFPKRVKFRKQQRGRLKGFSKGATRLQFGDYGLKALQSHWITARQIEAVRLTVMRFLKKGGKLWIRIFPDKPFTKKPAETRMGKGKGDPQYWVAVVRKGRVMFELGGVSKELALEAFRLAQDKLPIPCKFIERPLWS